MLRFTKAVVTAATVLYSIPLTAWLLFRYWQGEAWPMVGMLNAVGIWWFSPLLVVLPVALLVRARQALLMSGAILLVAVALFGGDFVPGPAVAAPAEGVRFRVLSFNVLVENFRFDEVVQTIEAHEPDLIAIQELSPEMEQAINATLGERYPYQLLQPWSDPRGIGLWSRYPLMDQGTLSQGLWENWAQSVVVDVEGQPLHLFNVHLWPIGTLDRQRFARALSLQHAQAGELTWLVQQIDVPVLVVGDFNASPTNETYAHLATQLDDVWRQVAWGPGFTFPSSEVSFYPFLRIDYMWSKGAIEPLSIRVLPKAAGSDHLPLLGEFVLTR